MGFFSFLKKKEEHPFGMEPLKLDLKPPVETVRPSPMAPHTPEVPSFETFKPFPEPMPIGGPPRESRDIELLSAKLDTIKVMLENLSHRLERIEQQQQQKERARW